MTAIVITLLAVMLVNLSIRLALLMFTAYPRYDLRTQTNDRWAAVVYAGVAIWCAVELWA